MPPKKIVICCDGTGNDFRAPNATDGGRRAGTNSNVVKLYTALQIDNEQVGYYHPGVGTMGAPTATHAVSRWWSVIKGLAFGAGFSENVLDAYRYLMEVYNDNHGDGDEVYIFGFSRGAYTARALAGFLHGYGLLCRGNEGHIPYAWRMYVAQHERRDRAGVQPDHAFMMTFSHKDFKIQFVGLWDTVSSIGWISSPLRLFNMTTNPSILCGRHAISIDERRCFFQDNLWGEPDARQDLRQVWFAGVHSDVGGSYPQPEAGLAYTALRWMIAEAGLLPDANGVYPKGPGVRLNPERYGLIFGEPPATPDDAVLRYHRPTRSRLHRSLRGPWWILEFLPVVYYDKDDGREKRRVPLGLRARHIPDGSLVHESVLHRLRHGEYRPDNLRADELAPGTALPASRDGTHYLAFHARHRRAPGTIPAFLDRFVWTWIFGLFDVLIVLPLLVAALVLLVGALVLFAKAVVLAAWHHPWLRDFVLVRALVAWFCGLWHATRHFLRCLDPTP